MPVSRAGVAGTKQKKRLQWRDKKGCCRSCVIWAKMASIDRERSRVFRPRRHSQRNPSWLGPPSSRIPPKVCCRAQSGLLACACRAARASEHGASCSSRCRFFFLVDLTVFARTPPQCGPTLSAPPRGRRAREHSRAEGPKAADPSAFPHYQSHHGRPQQPALGGAVEPVLLFAATHPGHVLFPGFRKTWPHGPRTALVATAAFEFGRGICMYATP